ncbi:WXG100 family type VII secretion target [Gordonia sp. CPCC 205515]|uniref:WXG100 family type VII secretion target n=1 Tax=Gordonia sp. CPCC 205515 TaxID=3140791 RepID=UPI003AF34AC1
MDSGGNNPGDQLQVIPDDVKQVGAAIRAAQQTLHRALNTTAGDVHNLTSVDWTGDAAKAFGEGWNDCHRGGTEILDALERLAEKLHVSGDNYSTSESVNTSTFTGLNMGVTS